MATLIVSLPWTPDLSVALSPALLGAGALSGAGALLAPFLSAVSLDVSLSAAVLPAVSLVAPLEVSFSGAGAFCGAASLEPPFLTILTESMWKPVERGAKVMVCIPLSKTTVEDGFLSPCCGVENMWALTQWVWAPLNFTKPPPPLVSCGVPLGMTPWVLLSTLSQMSLRASPGLLVSRAARSRMLYWPGWSTSTLKLKRPKLGADFREPWAVWLL